ncbi:MAG: glycosyltransferase family 4 protein [Kosmotoga sp.]|nr:MAG: glycosyltransferase family 4 protein [Kosmotoga sp.]
MKIIYVSLLGSKIDGVAKKIISEFSALRESNEIESKLVTLASRRPEKSLEKEIMSFDGKLLWSDNKRSRLCLRKQKFELAFGEINKMYPNNTIIYIRYPIADKYFFEFLKRIESYTIITEHQEKENSKHILLNVPLRYISEYIYGKRVRKKIDAFVGVTREILEYEFKRSGNASQKKGIVIGNGIDVSSVPLRKPPDLNDNIELLFVGSIYRTHAIDRLIKGFKNYKGRYSYKLHIIGKGPETKKLKRLVNSLQLRNRVLFHGFKTGEELDEFFDKCHIAIGSLGLHRIGLSEGSTLKVREYCARGVPFIYGVPDVDFSEDFPYVLRVTSNEEPVDIRRVTYFVERVFSIKDHPRLMREYALNKLDWSIKMKQLVKFMNEILEEK